MPDPTTMYRLGRLLPILLVFVAAFAGRHAALADDCIKPEWKVESVRLLGAAAGARSYVQLGDTIVVTSANLADLRKCARPNNAVLLYLDGMPLKGMLEYPPSNPAGQEALFTLQIGTDDRTAWHKLLGSPDIGTTKPVAVSLGLADGYPLPSDARMTLRSLPPLWFSIWAVLFVGGLIAFFWLARTSNLIRGGTPAHGRAFSMARSQAAWWFFLILGAYLLIGLTTGDYTNSLNSTALILLGIAAATYVGSVAVDESKNTPGELAAQDVERRRLQALAVAGTITPAEADKLSKLNGESHGWLTDVLSDSEGIDFHRFQMLVWTFVLGIVFVTKVWRDLAMPEFDTTLLGLMGLSAGTYVGLKIPETTK